MNTCSMCVLFKEQSDLVYPNSLVPIKMCSDCETCGLLNHCEYKTIKEVTRKCSDCEAYGLKKHGLTRSEWYTVSRNIKKTILKHYIM